MRRLRATEALRNLVRETLLDPADFILPLFICPGEGVRREISSMPGHAQLSVDRLVVEGAEAHSLGIGGVILFGIPETKDEMASGAYTEDGIIQQGVRALKREVPKLLVMTDVCNCEYTSHGHCGLVVDGEGGGVSCPRRRRYRGSQRHDGWPRGSHSHGAGCGRVQQHSYRFLRRQIRFGFLRAVSRGSRIHAPIRRPAQLSDGSGQCARSPARN